MAGTTEKLFAPGEDWSDHGGVEWAHHNSARAGFYEQAGAAALKAKLKDYDQNDNMLLADQQATVGD